MFFSPTGKGHSSPLQGSCCGLSRFGGSSIIDRFLPGNGLPFGLLQKKKRIEREEKVRRK